MTIHLSADLEVALRRIAGVRGQEIGVLVEEVIRQYLEADAIKDVTPEQVASTQAAMLGELSNIPAWPEQERGNDEAG